MRENMFDNLRENAGIGSPLWKGKMQWIAMYYQLTASRPPVLSVEDAKKVELLINDPLVVDYLSVSAVGSLVKGATRMRGTGPASKKTTENLSVIVDLLRGTAPPEIPAAVEADTMMPWRALLKWYYPQFYALFKKELGSKKINVMIPDLVSMMPSVATGPDDGFDITRALLPYTSSVPGYDPKPAAVAAPVPDPMPDPLTPVAPVSKPVAVPSVSPSERGFPGTNLDDVIATMAAKEAAFRKKEIRPGVSLPCSRAETDAQTRERLTAVAANIGLLRKLAKIYSFIRNGPYVWAEPKDAQIYTAVWLIRNGSIVLKGVPGTGKTQLVEMSAMFFGNDVWQSAEPQRHLATLADMKSFLLERGVLGEAKHNQEKEPQDVFFSSEISIERRRLPTERQIPIAVSSRPASNPVDYGELGFRKEPDEVERYSIAPVPKPIVTSMIKFHNEANRMNVNVADTLLGMMAENQVEYHGTTFYSPSEWNESESRLDLKHMGEGSINVFDYNPHLEMEHPEMELDRALLDRITAGIFISAGDLATRYQVLDKRQRGNLQPREVAFRTLKARQIEPITRKELPVLWNLTSLLPFDAEANSWINFLTNIPNLSNRTYSDAYATKPTKEPKGQIDKSTTTFSAASQGQRAPKIFTGQLATDLQEGVDNIVRPAGMRAALAMAELTRACGMLEALSSFDVEHASDEEILRRVGSVRIYVTNGALREVLFDELLSILPYILDHRINLGVTPEIQKSFASTQHLFKHYFKPLMLDKARKDRYFAYMIGLMSCEAVYGVAGKAPLETVMATFHDQVVNHYNDKHGIDGHNDWTVESLTTDRAEDSFLQSLYRQLDLYIMKCGICGSDLTADKKCMKDAKHSGA